MKAKAGLPQSVRLNDELGVSAETSDSSRNATVLGIIWKTTHLKLDSVTGECIVFG